MCCDTFVNLAVPPFGPSSRVIWQAALHSSHHSLESFALSLTMISLLDYPHLSWGISLVQRVSFLYLFSHCYKLNKQTNKKKHELSVWNKIQQISPLSPTRIHRLGNGEFLLCTCAVFNSTWKAHQWHCKNPFLDNCADNDSAVSFCRREVGERSHGR